MNCKHTGRKIKSPLDLPAQDNSVPVETIVMPVAVLFARRDSVYKELQGTEVYDVDRNAMTYRVGWPVVAHPPCRLWGKLRMFSNAPESEKKTAYFALKMVRLCGGVLEHPASSLLWNEAKLPKPGKGKDKFGGWTLSVPQWWWGHPAEKKTWLYIVGVSPRELPEIPFKLGQPEYVVGYSRRNSHGKKEMSKTKRDVTPKKLAEWLLEVARRTQQV